MCVKLRLRVRRRHRLHDLVVFGRCACVRSERFDTAWVGESTAKREQWEKRIKSSQVRPAQRKNKESTSVVSTDLDGFAFGRWFPFLAWFGLALQCSIFSFTCSPVFLFPFLLLLFSTPRPPSLTHPATYSPPPISQHPTTPSLSSIAVIPQRRERVPWPLRPRGRGGGGGAPAPPPAATDGRPIIVCACMYMECDQADEKKRGAACMDPTTVSNTTLQPKGQTHQPPVLRPAPAAGFLAGSPLYPASAFFFACCRWIFCELVVVCTCVYTA